ncbi:septation protein A [Inmirania thermothiophila]|nr:septation protein A [Inmirania thermothiophila]
MKLLVDFLPVLLFFAAYQLWDIYVATAAAIVAGALQVAWAWLRHGRVEPMPLVTLAVLVLFGGATLLLHDERFIKWKPTLVNWLFAAGFLASHFVGRRPLIQRLLAANIELPPPVWRRLSWMWIAFFAAMGVINLFVAYRFSTDVWVDFKLFGMLGLTLVFVLVQGLYLARHIAPEQHEEGSR